ncbi:AGC family protein kinase [Trichomonas vaginalis G3]|uniref:non-specific serine/threonine protein kinase n=1 Tax=Trichomonas vaginalis (strain ATCC PRA-98 / G3) TaxID=412133 RepID=A2ETU6_TRIV3|nr:cAMP-dependent protein kinase protein [Trichomonas vaginalis G3]EAY03901.1 AGC family protein kinase [Trichomonas vaginalis G3]KAI5502823.1 cAMP-dependent protein kinase protein [Trichomonas vaginalis G3]|eukprot:XP_001316124.1 AGC family protein kinase [Trichomonas vaginalis G3]
MKGVLLHCSDGSGNWIPLHYWLEGCTLKVSKTESFEEIIQQIEINEQTNIFLQDCQGMPTFYIENENFKHYELKASPVEVYSWVFCLRSCIFSTSNHNYAQFRKITKLGSSPYGDITLCEYNDTLNVIIEIGKKKLVEFSHVESYIPERNLIFSLPQNQFLLNLLYTFQDANNYYLSLEYPPSELLPFLSGLPMIPEDVLRFYASELVVTLDFLHNHFIVYRGLTSSNIFLAKDGHVKLGGYGTDISSHRELEYLAPEIIQGQPYGKAVDWWSLGIILYEILYEETPFFADSPEKIKKNILENSIKFVRFRGSPISELILQLLEKDPKKRITIAGIKKSKFFEGVDWNLVSARLSKPEAFIEPGSTDYTNLYSTDFQLNSEFLPTSSTYTGIENFSLGQEYSSPDEHDETK